ncbi:DUF5610 domain-containing protein [Marinobacterium aestuariivivens]|uniref:DUF5610 domain-containing protein n=1 Tax=Marinobacterium aestuariivivens TaxID=1698799 RepID=A0ABW2A4I2_9GAMM
MEIKPNFGQQVSQLARSDQRPAGGIGKEVSAEARSDKDFGTSSRDQQNRAILDASLQVSISSGNRSMELLYRAAIDRINEVLTGKLGGEALQTSLDQGLDVSPEATAGRIVSLTTAFLPQYLEQHPELAEDEGRARFTELIRGGIQQGFDEARELLDGLGVLQGDIADNIDRTWELVQQGLDAFMNPETGTGEAPA